MLPRGGVLSPAGFEAETVGAVLYKIHMRVLDAQQEFFAARRPRKDSPHTTDAYRRDLAESPRFSPARMRNT